MRVLQICSKPPLPAIDGGCLASYQLSKNLLKAGFEVSLISLATEKHPYLPDEIDKDYSNEVNLDILSVKTALKPAAVFVNLFENKSIQEHRFYHHAFAKKLVQSIRSHAFDFIVFDGLLSCVYARDVRKACKAKMIYRSHNAEHSIFEQRKELEKNLLKKFYLNAQAARIMRFEMSIWNSMDAVLSISSNDIDTMKRCGINRENTKVLPFGVEVNEAVATPKKNTLFHLGAMDWEPNIAGVKWFVKEVWPMVHTSHPETELHLGGKNITAVKHDLIGEGIEIHELVPDATTFTEAFDILIVPIHTGSGIRIKVLQAMAAGNVVVSTEKGLEGIDVEDGKQVLIANEADSFARCLKRLCTDNEYKETLRTNARAFIKRMHHPDGLSEQLKNWMIQL